MLREDVLYLYLQSAGWSKNVNGLVTWSFEYFAFNQILGMVSCTYECVIISHAILSVLSSLMLSMATVYVHG